MSSGLNVLHNFVATWEGLFADVAFDYWLLLFSFFVLFPFFFRLDVCRLSLRLFWQFLRLLGCSLGHSAWSAASLPLLLATLLVVIFLPVEVVCVQLEI